MIQARVFAWYFAIAGAAGIVAGPAGEAAPSSSYSGGTRVAKPRRARRHSETARRATGEQPPRFFAGLGLLSHHPGRMSTTVTGAKGSGGALYGFLSAAGHIPVDWFFGPDSMLVSPSFLFTPLGHGAPDGGSSSRVLILQTRVSRRVEQFDFGPGLGLLFYLIQGNGGTQKQNNGTTTQNYALPAGSALSMIFLFDLGAGVQIDRFRVDLDIGVGAMFSARRSLEAQLGVSYGIF